MSIVIKSNNVAVNNLGTPKMLGTTPELELAKYTARVEADGGVVKDSDRALKMLKKLFELKMYGNSNHVASGSFGVKTSGTNTIEKLYSLDGHDLVSKVIGTGIKPVLTTDNMVSFAANDSGQFTNGALLTSVEPHIQSKVGNFASFIQFKKISESGRVSTVFSLGLHDDVASNRAAFLVTNRDSAKVQDAVARAPYTPTSVNLDLGAIINLSSYDFPPHVTFLDRKNNQMRSINRGGGGTNSAIASNYLTELTKTPFYTDLGADYNTVKKYFSDATIDISMTFKHATLAQAQALSAFYV